MKKHPSIWSLQTVVQMATGPGPRCDTLIGGKWYPARPLGAPFRGYRLKAAWLVFTGQADALIWPGGQ